MRDYSNLFLYKFGVHNILLQSDLDYPDFLIIQTYFSGPFFLWILIRQLIRHV